ncbi:MAG: hypothetical protein JWM57_3091 [Phycisphaerales bacterium]|nr:hypothetical protein [Phycisphaerales bacterium]
MIEIAYLPPEPIAQQSGRFIASGVILLLVATVFGCFTGLMPVGYAMQVKASQMAAGPNYPVTYSPAGVPTSTSTQTTLPSNVHFTNRYAPAVMPVSQLIGAIALYLTLTVGCGWLGIAAFLKRRYVRPLVVVLSTQGIILGVFTCAMMAAMTPLLFEQASLNRGGMGGPAFIGFIVGFVAVLLFFVAPPVILLILMKPDSVRAAAEQFDLRPRWTDGLPLRVLGLILTLVMIAASELFVLARPRLPMFLGLLTGFPVVILILGHLALMCWATAKVYRREDAGWRIGFWAVVVPAALFLISSVTLPSEQYIELMKDQPNAQEMIQGHELLFRSIWTGIAAAFLVGFAIYMIRVRSLVTLPANEPATANTQ